MWSYYDEASVQQKQLDASVDLIRFPGAQGIIEFIHCSRCAVTLAWLPTDKGRQQDRQAGNEPDCGINMRLLGPKALVGIEREYGDG